MEALIRVMALDRLCDPDSRLGVLRWLQTAALPEIGVKSITRRQLLRSMDALMDQRTEVLAVLAGVSSINNDLSELLSALRVRKPVAGQQLTLL